MVEKRLSFAAFLCLGLAEAFIAPVSNLNRLRGSCTASALGAGKDSWSVLDDWNALSEKNKVDEGGDMFRKMEKHGPDYIGHVARDMERRHRPSGDNKISEEDEFVADTVDFINHYGAQFEPDPEGPALYDTDEKVKQVSFEDEMGQEISMLVRCNESPESMLVDGGRALPPLTEEQLNDMSQLVEKNDDDHDGEIEVTTFFREAVSVMFHEHATKETKSGIEVLDARCVASWMTRSLGSERRVTPHDKRVLTTLSRFGEYGTGRLTESDFQNLYYKAISSALDGSALKNKKAWRVSQPTINSVFRDIRNHGILSPVELERKMKALEIEEKYGGSASTEDLSSQAKLSKNLVDECEILDSEYSETSTMKNSYKKVQMARDGKTPLWVRDGQFGKS